jgi:hypothetical protein
LLRLPGNWYVQINQIPALRDRGSIALGELRMIKLRTLWRVFAVALLLQAATFQTANSQITEPRKLSASLDRYANLEEQLVNRLRAFDQEKRSYIKMVVKKVSNGKLDVKLVLAVAKYAIRRNAEFPFPFFERALQFEAGKRGVVLPTVRQFASTKESRR